MLGVVASGDGPWKEARGPRVVESVGAGGGTGGGTGWGENGDGIGHLKASSGTDGSSSAASDWGGRTDGRSSADGNVQSSNNGNKS